MIPCTSQNIFVLQFFNKWKNQPFKLHIFETTKWCLVIYFLLTSCDNTNSLQLNSQNRDQNPERQILYFDLKKLPELSKVKLSELGIVDIQYIPLHTNSDNVISQISVLIALDNYFLISDIGKSPLLFANDGSFISKIGTRGKGPNEITGIDDIDINPLTGSIYISCNYKQQKFLVFDKYGKLLHTFKSPEKGEMKFKFTADGILCYYHNTAGNIRNSFILIDTIGRIIKKFPNKYFLRNAYPIGSENENIFYSFNNQFLTKEDYSDTVFAFKNQKFEPYMILDLGAKQFTTEARKKIKNNQAAFDILPNYTRQWNIFEFGDFVYYEIGTKINEQRDLYSLIVSKSHGFKELIFPFEGLVNDIDGGPNIWPRTTKNDSILVSWIEAFKLKQLVSSEEFKRSVPIYPDKKERLENLVLSIHENDNPIIVLIKTKYSKDEFK